MTQNKNVIRILSIISILSVAFAIGFGVQYAAATTKMEVMQAEYHDMAEKFQVTEEALIIIDDWYVADGYEDAVQWWKDYKTYKDNLVGLRDSVEKGEYVDYATEEQLNRLTEIEKEAKEVRSIKELKNLSSESDQIKQAIIDAKSAAEAQATTVIEYNSGSSYNISSDGLTPQSGVNYYDGRTETYYSSNVLYHYKTNEWTLDDEGFYRTDDGYYVVAASDMPEGTTFETSKGTAIVLDSGCSEGVTDFYVGW